MTNSFSRRYGIRTTTNLLNIPVVKRELETVKREQNAIERSLIRLQKDFGESSNGNVRRNIESLASRYDAIVTRLRILATGITDNF